MVGNSITTLRRHFTAKANDTLLQATRSVLTLTSTAVSKERKAYAFGSSIVPRAIANTQWNLPSFPAMDRLRTIILSGSWGCRALMRCVGILLSVFFDPTKLDPSLPSISRLAT